MHGFHKINFILINAEMNSHLDCLNYAHEHGCPE